MFTCANRFQKSPYTGWVLPPVGPWHPIYYTWLIYLGISTSSNAAPKYVLLSHTGFFSFFSIVFGLHKPSKTAMLKCPKYKLAPLCKKCTIRRLLGTTLLVNVQICWADCDFVSSYLDCSKKKQRFWQISNFPQRKKRHKYIEIMLKS